MLLCLCVWPNSVAKFNKHCLRLKLKIQKLTGSVVSTPASQIEVAG